MSATMKHTTFLMAAMGLMALAGCGKNTGFLIKPVPLDETLQETVIAKDSGMFVRDKIVIVDVDGLLMNVKDSELFGTGENPVSLFIEKLDKAQMDKDVKGVVLRINSPGGGVTASDIMYHRLRQFKAAKGVPVVCVIEDVGASGGYYIACGSDRILAHPTSVTGSIGVIVQAVSFAGTLERLGISAKAITSGQFKDMGSPLKPFNKKDHELLQLLVNEYYEGFVGVVCAGRPKLSKDKVRELADGRVYTGKQALAAGLVDELGYMDNAIAQAKQRSGSSRVKVVMYHRPLGYKPNAYAASGVPQVNMVNVRLPALMELAQPQFLYLWTGSAAQR